MGDSGKDPDQHKEVEDGENPAPSHNEDQGLSSDPGRESKLSELVSSIKSKLKNNQPFTEIGSRVHIVANPRRDLDLFSAPVSRKYALQTLKLGGPKATEADLPPHIFAIAGDAVRRVMDNNEDVSVTFLGDAGSGKTEASRLFIRQLTRLSQAMGQSPGKVTQRILNIDIILDAFCAYQKRDTSSRSLTARYTEIQYNDVEIIGAKLITYLMNSKHIVHRDTRDRSANVFHYLLVGASKEEEIQLRLSEAANSPYVKIKAEDPSEEDQIALKAQVARDRIHLNSLRECLKSFGIGRRLQSQIFRTVALVLHLGILTFVDKEPSDGSGECCAVKNRKPLEFIAELIGVSAGLLDKALVSRIRVSKNNDAYTQYLSAREAEASRDDLSTTLYTLLVSYIVECINRSICNEDCMAFIGVIDFPGFDPKRGGSESDEGPSHSMEMYTLLRNYANEHLVNFLCERLSSFNVSYMEDGIRSVAPTFTFQNPLTLLALGGGEHSLITLLDPHSQRTYASQAPKGRQLDSLASSTFEEVYTSAKDQAAALLRAKEKKSGDRKQPKGPLEALMMGHAPPGRGKKTGWSSQDDKDVRIAHLPFEDDIMHLIPGKSTNEEEEKKDNKSRKLFTMSDAKELKRKGSELLGGRNRTAKPTIKENAEKESHGPAFLIKHYGNTIVRYSLEGLLTGIPNEISPDILTIILGSTSSNIIPSANPFLRELVSTSNVDVNRITGGRTNDIITSAFSRSTPKHTPSIRHRTLKRTRSILSRTKTSSSAIGGFLQSLSSLIDTMHATVPWFVVCIATSESLTSKKPNSKLIKSQLDRMGIPELSQSFSSADYGVVYTIPEFLQRYQVLTAIQKLDESSGSAGTCEDFALAYGWTRNEMSVGRTCVFLSDKAWRSLEGEVLFLRFSVAANTKEEEYRTRRTGLTSEYAATGFAGALTEGGEKYESSVFLNDEAATQDPSEHELSSQVDAAGSYEQRTPFMVDSLGNLDPPAKCTTPPEEQSPYKPTFSRRVWLCLSYSLTFCCVPICLKKCCGMDKKEVRVSWREKIAFNFLIYLFNIVILFCITGLSVLLCPSAKVLTPSEVADKSTLDDPYMYAYGRVYRVGDLYKKHKSFSPDGSAFSFTSWAGKDVSQLFTLTENQATFERYCPGFALPEDGWTNYANSKPAIPRNMYLHHIHEDVSDDESPTLMYLESMQSYSTNNVGWDPQNLMQKVESAPGLPARWVMLFDNVYDVSTYFSARFFTSEVTALLNVNGKDITKQWRKLPISEREKRNTLACLNGLFYRGVVDHRGDLKCRATGYILIVVTGAAVGVICIKYISAFRFFPTRAPEKQERFVICFIPCCTEGYDSLGRTIRSVALSNYDDRFRLMFIVCDGLIVGKGNDRTTSEIALDILDPHNKGERVSDPLPFRSLGQGQLQNNYARVHCGIYENGAHAVPYIIITKIGGSVELSRPGNRGKRDSHLLLMNFLNRVHYNYEMNPLELELYRIMTEVIGVNPLFYEYVLMVDADTFVEPDAVNLLVSCMTLDTKIVGICGETRVANAKSSWVTMVQVYEYYISHTISKVFESLFGSVTCLPGCFCMYRIRSIGKGVPYLASNQILEEYKVNNVNTLHLKNLLTLGEDRYLTTLMMKHYPHCKTSYIGDAKCETNVPEHLSVLVSQRRRWINSTIHNLIELRRLQELCGVCFFSMRFVVLVEVLTTVIQPAGVLYIGYLIYAVIAHPNYSFRTSILMVIAVYGFQAVLAIVKQQWEYILWLALYIISLPYFALWIPLYSFWHVDDVSWGKTTFGSKDKGKNVLELKEFDPSLVPLSHPSNYSNPINAETRENNVHSTAFNTQDEVASITSHITHTDADSSRRTYASIAAPFQGAARMTQIPKDKSLYSQYVHPAVPQEVALPLLRSSAIANTRQQQPPTQSIVGPSNRRSAATGRYYGDQDATQSIVGQPRLAEGDIPKSRLYEEIYNIISNSDLMVLTKKQVRGKLEVKFGMDLTSKRTQINQIINEILQDVVVQNRT